ILGFSEKNQSWIELLPKFRMLGHAEAHIKLKASDERFKTFKVEMYPDGGFSRLALYEKVPAGKIGQFIDLEKAASRRSDDVIPKTPKPLSLKYEATPEKIKRNLAQVKPVNLAGLAFGARMIKATNEHYGPAVQVISPYPAIHMFDGLESARSRKPDHSEEVIIELAQIGPIAKIILDFKFFINNNPREIKIEGLTESNEWKTIVEKNNVKAFAGHKKVYTIKAADKFKQLKLITLPDGGINRIEVYS
ncbi:MAG: hypothetical protein ACXVAX_10360, partial [Pseudobdellovibrio sp.]